MNPVVGSLTCLFVCHTPFLGKYVNFHLTLSECKTLIVHYNMLKIFNENNQFIAGRISCGNSFLQANMEGVN